MKAIEPLILASTGSYGFGPGPAQVFNGGGAIDEHACSGLAIFLAIHSVSIVNDAWRNRMAAKIGE